ncbi:NucA/NucB deoxyribonuclease domain-containing protein [Planomonospora parontospora]|uniref:NucA/NucB deoxyribonuclease domain-containing protein n=1 Tax=Planomonospora parontospora TaxID=58119 RepID=UPI00166FC025|nr:hypothetical protein [Planomonospora parontospora]GGL42844.1 hypothetical protein GCM10014719_50220 [Planomonospora parontospora subsp. antibiotica]GII18556.1 hypothetical protein Ppa05_52820 [Planomonospora parontospora subsp. antibiotica]
MHSYLGNGSGTGVVGGGYMHPRNVKVWSRVDDFSSQFPEFLEQLIGGEGVDNEALEKTLSLQLKVTGGSRACSVVASDADNSGANRTAGVAKWINKGDNEFIVRSMDDGTAGDNISRCTIEPWLTYNNPKNPSNSDRQTIPGWGHPSWVNLDPERLRETAPRVRCDSRGMGGAIEHYKGGCIFYGASRVLRLNAWNWDYGQVARHIQKAFTQPQNTVPFKTDGLTKHIPGNWNAQKGSPERASISRISANSARYKANTKAKNAVCDEFFADRPLESNGAPKEEWQECDEYPFASTMQGGAYQHPEHGTGNFSVQAVLGHHNSVAGGDLGVFYARYRVLLGNNFWVAVS